MTSWTRGALCCALLAAGSAQALAEDATFEMTVMTPETALRVAQVSLESCRSKGFQVAVVVVDRMGVPQAMIRDRFAGAHTPDTAFRKAWTAVSFREDTLTLSENTAPGTPQAGARDITNALMLGGGVPDPERWTEWLRAHPRAEWPEGVTLSQVTIQPFYDRAGLIQETLGTLENALTELGKKYADSGIHSRFLEPSKP